MPDQNRPKESRQTDSGNSPINDVQMGAGQPALVESGQVEKAEQAVFGDNAMQIVLNELDKAEKAISVARSDLNGRKSALREVTVRIEHLQQEVALEERSAIESAAAGDEIRVRAAVEAADELRREMKSLLEERDRYRAIVRKLADYLDELQSGVGQIRGQLSGFALAHMKQV